MTLYRIETNKKCIFCLNGNTGMPPYKPLVVQLQLDDKGDTDRHGHRIIGYLCNVCNCVWNGETEEHLMEQGLVSLDEDDDDE